MDKVRCKVSCTGNDTRVEKAYDEKTSKHYDKTVANLTFVPVYAGSEENKAFFASTPTLQLSFGTVNGDAAAMFQIGKEYYLDLTPAN